jgi:hypothetical protein
MATMNITMSMHTDRMVDALAAAAERWSEAKRDAFGAGWKALEALGAEMVEVRACGGVVQAFPSEDFTRYCTENGVPPWW